MNNYKKSATIHLYPCYLCAYYAEAVLKFAKLNTVAQQREAVAQGRSLPPIPASV
jgi:hypothetical protein